MKIDIETALKELDTENFYDMQESSAKKWVSLAAAAYLKSLEAELPTDSLVWMDIGNEFGHFAIAHAAAMEDGGVLLTEIQETLMEYKTSAFYGLGGDDDVSLTDDVLVEPIPVESAEDQTEKSETSNVVETTENSQANQASQV